MRERLAAVVVHWQDPEETLACVEALDAEPPDEIVVVDNGSRAPVGDLLATHAPQARVLRLPENRGYAGGANAGLEAALANGATTLLLLNNDARVACGAEAAAARALGGDPRIGVVGAKVVTRENPTRLWLAWGDVTWGPSLVALRGADVADGPEWNVPHDVDWVAGCAMWFRATALRAVGLLDECFFAYHEEVDWCARARAAGWRVAYRPEVVVSHTGRGSHGSPHAIRIRKYFGARNSILYARKHAGPAAAARLALGLAASLPLQLGWHLLRGTPGEAVVKLRGIRDGLTGREPPFAALGLR
jgi:hypothetical protein